MPGAPTGGEWSSRASGMAAMGEGLEATWKGAGSPVVGTRMRGMMMWGTAGMAKGFGTWDQLGSPAAAPAIAGASNQGTLAAKAVTAGGPLRQAAQGGKHEEAGLVRREITSRATVRTVYRGGSSAAESRPAPQRPAAEGCTVGVGKETRASRVTRVGADRRLRLPPKLIRGQFMTRWVQGLLEPSHARYIVDGDNTQCVSAGPNYTSIVV